MRVKHHSIHSSLILVGCSLLLDYSWPSIKLSNLSCVLGSVYSVWQCSWVLCMFSGSQSSSIVFSPLCSRGKGYQLGDELNVDRSVIFSDTEAWENNRIKETQITGVKWIWNKVILHTTTLYICGDLKILLVMTVYSWKYVCVHKHVMCASGHL